MVDTIKFSEMTDGGDIGNNDKVPGLLSNANVLFNNPWTFLPPGTTAERPAPSAAINYRLRFNTDDQVYEYYDAVSTTWVQVEGSAVTHGPFITYEADATLPDAQNLGLLANGILKQTVSTGVATIDILAIPLTVSNGGTGASSFTAYGVICGGTTSTGALQTVSGLGIANQVLVSNGASALPTWQSVPGLSPAALTKSDDTNVTLTLGGTPTSALLQATSLTLGWTGTLSGTRGGTGINNGSNTATFGGNINFASSFTTSGSFAVTQTYTNVTNVTFPTSGTLATTSQIPTGAALTKVDDTNVTLTLGGSPTTALINASSLTLGWTGTLGGSRGGTGVNNGSNTVTYAGNLNFAGSFTTVGAFAVTQTYTGITNVTFPTSGTLATTSSLPTGAPLTKTDDTNVTLTLGGSPPIALLNAASLTLGWTGQLILSRGGTNASLTASNGGIVWSNASQFQVLAGTSTANQLLLSGASSTPSWSTLTMISTITANQLLYASSTNVIGTLTPGTNTVLWGNGSSVPSFTATPRISTLGLGVTATNTLDVNGNVAIGTSYAGTITPATNGLYVQGQSSFGSAFPNSAVQLTSSVSTTGLAVAFQAGGIATLQSNNDQYGIWSASSFTPASNISGFCAGIQDTSQVSPPVGVTIANYAQLHLVPSTNSGIGVVTKAWSIYADTPLAGSSNYGAYIGGKCGFGTGASTPANQVDIAFNLSVGFTNTSAPSNGAAINGQVVIGSSTITAQEYFRLSPSFTASSGLAAIQRFSSSTLTAAATGDEFNMVRMGGAILATTAGSFTGLKYYGLKMFAPTITGNGTFSQAYGVYVQSFSSIATTQYSGYFEAPTGGTTNIGVYAENISINTTSPVSTTRTTISIGTSDILGLSILGSSATSASTPVAISITPSLTAATAGGQNIYSILNNTTFVSPAANAVSAIGYYQTGSITLTGNLTSYYGIKLDNPGKTGAGTITTAWGLQITKPTIATTNYSASFGTGVGIGTTTPLNACDIVGNLSIGTSVAAPSSGLTVSGKTLLRTSSSTYGAGIEFGGTDRITFAVVGGNTSTDGAAQISVLINPSFAPTSTTTSCSALDIYAQFNPPTGVTITTAYGHLIQGGGQGGLGAVSTGINLYVENPGFGTTKICTWLNGATTINTGTVDGTSMLTVSGGISAFSRSDGYGVITINQTANAGINLLQTSNSSAPNSSVLQLVHTRGTYASPTATQSGDALGAIDFGGYTNAINGTGAVIIGVAAETWTSSAAGSDLNIYVTKTGSLTNSLAFTCSANGNVVCGGNNGAALATNATNGFFYVPSGAGTPTGVPTSYTGRIAAYYDTTANKIWFYNGSWRGALVV